MGDALDIQRRGSALLNPELDGPHPSPLPEGEGTEWGMVQGYADLILLYRIHNRLVLSGRCQTSDASVGPLSLWERAGVRVETEFHISNSDCNAALTQ
jgi:hypothetical protein